MITAPSSAGTRPVYLLHGLGRTVASMQPLAWRMKRAGLKVDLISYPSTRTGLIGAIAHVRERLRARLARQVDLVGHSLGGLVAGHLLRGDAGVRRVVQIGAPNLGSPLAGRLGGLWPIRQFCGPAVEDLTPPLDRPEVDRRIGAIAGTLAFGPGRLPGPNDGAVTVRSAWAGAGHRATVPVQHTLLPTSARVADLAIFFLREGSFPKVGR